MFILVPLSSQRFQTTLQSTTETAKTHNTPLSSVGFTFTSSDTSFPHEEETPQL